MERSAQATLAWYAPRAAKIDRKKAHEYRTAVHEAGHAVIARVLTLASGPASIVADPESAGHAITADPNVTVYEWGRRGKVRFTPRPEMVGRVLAYMAGAEAERVLLGKAGRGDGEDRWQIALMLEDIGPIDAEHYEQRLRKMTRMLVRCHRERIKRVAAVLLSVGT